MYNYLQFVIKFLKWVFCWVANKCNHFNKNNEWICFLRKVTSTNYNPSWGNYLLQFLYEIIGAELLINNNPKPAKQSRWNRRRREMKTIANNCGIKYTTMIYTYIQMYHEWTQTDSVINIARRTYICMYINLPINAVLRRTLRKLFFTAFHPLSRLSFVSVTRTVIRTDTVRTFAPKFTTMYVVCTYVRMQSTNSQPTSQDLIETDGQLNH